MRQDISCLCTNVVVRELYMILKCITKMGLVAYVPLVESQCVNYYM
jgi:hypothetical protein